MEPSASTLSGISPLTLTLRQGLGHGPCNSWRDRLLGPVWELRKSFSKFHSHPFSTLPHRSSPQIPSTFHQLGIACTRRVVSGSCPQAWCQPLPYVTRGRCCPGKCMDVLGWPKSSFGFFMTSDGRPERTFWPPQYLYLGLGIQVWIYVVLGLQTPDGRSLPHPPPCPSIDQSSRHTATKELPPTAMPSSLQKRDCPLQQSLTCTLTMLVPFFPVTLRANPSPTPPIPPGPAGLLSPNL